MVRVYYSREYIVNMSGSIKTGIISVAIKNGDYIKKPKKIKKNTFNKKTKKI